MRKQTECNLFWHHSTIGRAQREARNHHRGSILWFTGLSGSGKSTLAYAVEARLQTLGCHTYVLDGDNIRHGLCRDLGFTEADRNENIRRIGEVAKLFVDAGLLVLTAFISPFKADRDQVRALVPSEDFLEIYCDCPLAVCEQRDVKGLYKRARAGEIPHFTGISAPYEAPPNPELRIPTGEQALGESVDSVVGLLVQREILGRQHATPYRH